MHVHLNPHIFYVFIQGSQLASQSESTEGNQYPVIGAVPEIDGAYVSTGFGLWSTLLAPAAAVALAGKKKKGGGGEKERGGDIKAAKNWDLFFAPGGNPAT